MAIYARSDLVLVTVSRAHGGCGIQGGHRRPVEHGAPAKLWKLECPECEDFLRSDPTWSPTLSEIPETPDEVRSREDFDKRGAKDRDQILALALAKLAGIELPDTLLRPLTGNMPHIPVAGQLECPDGHANQAGMKFCGECGAPLHGTVAKAQIAPPAAPAAPPGATESDLPPFLPSNSKMRGMKGAELAHLAAGAGLSTEGTRADLLNRLLAHNKAARAAA